MANKTTFQLFADGSGVVCHWRMAHPHRSGSQPAPPKSEQLQSTPDQPSAAAPDATNMAGTFSPITAARLGYQLPIRPLP